MRPRLVPLSASSVTEVPLPSGGLTIGRDSSNTIRLEETAVSLHHCRIEHEGKGFVLVDGESQSGTFVNGRTALRVRLGHGDEIQVGAARFCFLVDEEGIWAPIRITDDAGAEGTPASPIATETLRLHPQVSAYLYAPLHGDGEYLGRLARDMNAILRLNGEINSISDAVELQEVLLKRTLDRIPAETGVILLGNSVDELVTAAGTPECVNVSAKPLYVSRAILQEVMESGEAVLRNDMLPVPDAKHSAGSAMLRSVLCVPLTVMAVRTGVLYLSTSDAARPFDRRHLEMVTAIAGIGALALEHIRYLDWLESENQELTKEVSLGHGMVGASPQMKSVYEAISRIAPTGSPVLVLGETGSGKELAARAIHGNSSRRNGPFIPVNCGAVQETLFSSQLFGYVKGAFTGADRDHKGFIEEADGGTLFLDELGELPLHCQAALLRVLEEGRVQRVGSSREIAVDVRLISATNRSLNDEIASGNFRSDLFFRMGLPVTLPPLRERLDDVPLLARFFLQKHKGSAQREIESLHPDTVRTLQQHTWPGNVRELSRAIYWAVVFGKSNRIRPEDLPADVLRGGVRAAPPTVGPLEDALQSHEKKLIVRALQETRGNVVEAAALLARAPNYLQRRINQLKLRTELDRIRAGGEV
jgi:two-component system response regulator HydG